MSPRRGTRSVRGLLVALVGVLGVAAGTWLTADAPPGLSERDDVASAAVAPASVVCPAPGEAGRLSAAVLALTTDAPAATLRVAQSSASAADGVLQVPGEELAEDLSVVTADPVTPDLAATVDRTRPRLSATACVVAGGRAWFTGVGAEIDHAATLELVNPESGPAVVRVRVLGPEGPVETVDLREVSVPAGERVTVDLADAAPAIGEVALEVRTTRGRVAAFVTDRVGTLGTGRPATESVPSQTTPRRQVVLGGLPARADGHVLVVANPGEFEALGTLAVLGPDGTFVPEADAELRVPPGGTVAVDVSEAVGTAAAAIRVTADSAVTAVVRSQVGADMAYAGPVRPLGAASGAVLPAGVRSVVQLSSDGDARELTVQPYAADGRVLEAQQVTVPVAGTVAVTLPERARSVVVRDGGSGVRGAVVLRSDAGVAVLPLRPGAARAPAPVVVPVVR